MRIFIHVGFSFCILMFCLISCSKQTREYVQSFNFNKSIKTPVSYKSKSRLVIQTFIDDRNPKNISNNGVQYIPFYPYAKIRLSKPEVVFNSYVLIYPEIDLAKALQTELEDYYVFEAVEYSDRTVVKSSDYSIRCRILKDRMNINRTLYGTSAGYFASLGTLYAGIFPLLWFLTETDFAEFRIEIEVEILQTKTKQSLLKKIFVLQESVREAGIQKEDNPYLFLSLNQKIIHEIGKDLVQFFVDNKK